jgi:hypothetical protein
MTQIALRPDLIASRYANLAVGPSLLYSFETQKGLPVDGGNPLLRDLSPFTLRLIVPEILEEKSAVDVNLIGRANRDSAADIRSVRGTFGIPTVTGASTQAPYENLQRIVSAGQIVSGISGSAERAVFTDLTTAADIALQVERILNAPPLTLFVNPSELSVSYSTIQQFSNRSREGILFERWGEGLPTLSISGSTGVFMAAANAADAFGGQTETASPSGAQFAAKRDSAAFQNFTALYQFYRNNGYIYDTIGKSEAHLMIGSVAIDYDQWTYVGHIDSFDYSYQEGSPLRIEWSMEFTATRMYDHAEAPVVVMPMTAPSPNPSYPGRPLQRVVNRPDALSGGPSQTAQASGPGLASVPLSLLGG